MAAGSGAGLTPFAALLLPDQSQGAQQASSLSGVPVLDGVLDYDDTTLRAAGTDSGGMIERHPRAVLKPRSIEDVVRIVRYANEHRLTIAMRGRGHSRYGQAQAEGGIVIDSQTLNRLGGVSNNTIEVQAGASLESLVRAALDAGFALPVMTSCVMLSVGGFLSAGGQTRGSQRYGAFVDQVAELEVVTGDGRLVTCSETRERELFDMVLAGMGQCGIIVRAKLKVIPAPEQVALRTLTYTSLERFLRDQARLATDARFDVIEGSLVRREPNWTYRITVGNFGPAAADLDPVRRIGDLSHDAVSDATRQAYRSFVLVRALAASSPATDRQTPAPIRSTQRRVASPSLALWVPQSAAQELLTTLFSSPMDLGGVFDTECTALDTRRFHRPLFRVPSEERMFALWLLRAAFVDSGPSLETQLDANARLLERALAMGAKRYPPYARVQSPADWEHHYGRDLYRRFAAAKRQFDPRRVLTPGPSMFA